MAGIENGATSASRADRGSRHVEVAIVGAGFGGIGVAIELKRIGIHDLSIFEAADDLGGTWRDNTYPGLEVDIPSFSYCYSFEPSAEWSQVYAPGAEVKRYADHCADRYGIRPHIRFRTAVSEIRFDEARGLWDVHLDGGDRWTARYVVGASGYLVGPKLPDIEGMDSFRGKVMHTARWDHDHDLRGERAAVIGTGATAIQVIPAIADQLASLDVYQRTAIWLAPKPNRVLSPRTRAALGRFPILQKALRALNWWATEAFFATAFVNHKRFPWIIPRIERALVKRIRRQVEDPATQEKLIPTYSFFCKRPSFSNDFYPLFNRDEVALITDPIERVTETGIVTKDGTEREVDVIICATGYRVFDRATTPNFEVHGRHGKNLGDWWDEHRYQAYLGTTVPDFPNFFMIVGPYAAAGASYFDVLQNQVVHISRCLRTARRRGANVVEVKRGVHDRDFASVQKRAQGTVLVNGSCATSNSYYFDHRGDTPGGPRPSSPTEHWLRSRAFPMRNYEMTRVDGDRARTTMTTGRTSA